MFPSFEADKKYELATGLLFWENLNVSINLLAGFPTIDRRWNSVEISQTPSPSSKASASSQGKQETPPWSPEKGAGLSEHFSASVVFACAPVLTSGRGELPCRCRIWTHFFFWWHFLLSCGAHYSPVLTVCLGITGLWRGPWVYVTNVLCSEGAV